MKLKDLITRAAQLEGKKVAVASAEDEEVLEAVKMAVENNLAQFILIGDKEQVDFMVKEKNIPQDHITLIHARSKEQACEIAVKAVRQHEADVLMKGNISTSVILKAVLNKEFGLRTEKVLSHAAAFEVNGFEQLLFVTDAAMNIAPDLQQKVQIIENTVRIAKSIGITEPKVAPLAAVEVINPAMQATLDAAALTQMNKRGQIKNCIVDGPLALDNAVSSLAAEHKGIKSDVAGQADILLVPSIEAGNVLYKSFIYFADAKVGAVIAGAKAPIVLTSRSDSAESKLYSIALAICSSTNH
ncbi:phosphate butyryltransferase [Metabacillus arenae]|uniref:Phosphate butyryltransferase n=1 Tax=Metabacillus arenae TaxID=2771434 RepID=A0A926NIJ5_9BACI|nr:phosphate butyryltransferase [Metabacillus arenae]MBD1378777.1 phosphate butyryltransferase [Metabacillus arenae]